MAIGKTVQLSTRVTDDDAAFLARVDLDGAQTPSDKLRALITEARRLREGLRDYASSLPVIEDLVAPTLRAVRDAENQPTWVHSELMVPVIHWLVETLAYVASHAPRETTPTVDDLKAIEAGLADRLFSLMQALLRMGVTPAAPCYDPGVIASRLEPILALARVLEATRAPVTTTF